MARTYRPVVRDQVFLLPPDMAEWLPEDHLVWFVLDVVAGLDTTRFHARRRLGGVGRQGYDPDMLLGLLVYAYAVGERSSRRIERLCGDHVAFRVACAQDVPDHTTIARFRAEHQEEFAEVFAQVLLVCAQAGMVKFGAVAIDGTKIAANASRGANRSPEAVREEARRVAEETRTGARAEARRVAEDIVVDAETVDAAEDAEQAAGGGEDGLPPDFATRSGRAANLARAIAELDRQDAEDARADAADRARAEAWLARVESGEPITGGAPAGVDPGRWQQARITRLERQLAELEGVKGAARARSHTNQALKQARARLEHVRAQAAAGLVDTRGRRARHRDRREKKARRRGGSGRVVNVTDPESRLMTAGSGSGAVQGYNAQVAVTDDHYIVGVGLTQDANDLNSFTPTLAAALAAAKRCKQQIGLVLADAGYYTEANLTAAGPARLIAAGKHRDHARRVRERPTSGPPPEDATPEEAMQHRMANPAEYAKYKRRGATVEPVIGHLKDQTGLRRFARRGQAAALSELFIAATAVNLRRLHGIG